MPRFICYYLAAGMLALMLLDTSRAQFPGGPDGIAAFEGLRRGLQDVVRSASQSGGSNSGPSSPLIDAETARGMSYDNQIKQTNTYFEKRRLNQMYRAAEKNPRLAKSEYARLASQQAPDRLSSSQIDSYGGRINWPIVLRADEYSQNRQQVDKLYASHIQNGGGMNTPEYASIQQKTKEMQDQLRGNVSQVPSEQYVSARKFLDSLRYECRYPAGS